MALTAIGRTSLDMVAGGSIGAGPTYPVSVEMVQYQDGSGQIHDPLLNVSAGGNIVMDVRGRQRDGGSNPVTLDSEGISAGGNITIYEQQGLADGPATGTGGSLLVSATQQNQIGTYHSYYYPDSTAAGPTAIDNGLYGNMNQTTDVVTDYDFLGRDANGNVVSPEGLTAGGDMQIIPATGTPTINIDATMNVTGTVSATANGTILLTEYVGALRVGSISSDSTTSATSYVELWSTGNPAGSGLGHDILMGPRSTIASAGFVLLFVQDNFTMDQGAVISAPQRVDLFTDANLESSQVGPGSTVQIAGAIKSPIEIISQLELGTVPLNDTISLTNVQKGTVATITMEQAPIVVPRGDARHELALGSPH